MAPWAACLRERKRTYEGCRDLHQTRSVLAAVSGGGWRLRERELPSFGPMQEDLRICFETPEDGQEPRGNHASEAPHIASQNIVVRCNMARPRDGVKNRAGNFRRWRRFMPVCFDAISGNVLEQRSAGIRDRSRQTQTP